MQPPRRRIPRWVKFALLLALPVWLYRRAAHEVYLRPHLQRLPGVIPSDELCFTRDGGSVTVLRDDERILAWRVNLRDPGAATRRTRLEVPETDYDTGYNYEAAPDGNTVALMRMTDINPATNKFEGLVAELMLLDARTGKRRRALRIVGLRDDVAFSPDGRYIVAAAGPYHRAQAMAWEVRTGKPLGLNPTGVQGREALCVAFNRDATVAAVVAPPDARTPRADNERYRNIYPVDIIATGNGRVLGHWLARGDIIVRRPKLHHADDESTPQADIAIAPDGAQLVTLTDRGLMGRDSATGNIRWTTDCGAPGPTVTAVYGRGVAMPVYSPDGAMVACQLRSDNSPAVVLLLDAGTGEILRTLRLPHGDIEDFAFTADSRHLVCYSDDRTVATWNVP